MSKLFFLLLLGASPQLGQLGAPVAQNDPALVEAAKAARKSGLEDVMTYPEQSFAVSWGGVKLGTFLSLGARKAGSSYQCLQGFAPDDRTIAPSPFVVVGGGRFGAEICDHPRAIGILRSPPDRIRIGILYANSMYLNAQKTSGTEAPSVAVAVVIDPKLRTMALDRPATKHLEQAELSSLQAMRALF